MSKKQKRMWLSATLSIVELLILIILCNLNAHSFSLGFGGEKVAALQRILKQSNVYEGEINGLFDIETKNALKKLFPESGGEADCYVLEKLGLDCCCGFSALSELKARYVSYRADDVPFSVIEDILDENRVSELLRGDSDFFCKIKKLKSTSDACDYIYKYENNR